jgi:predicted Zn-dependent peptidase
MTSVRRSMPRPQVRRPRPWRFPVPAVTSLPTGMTVVGYEMTDQALVTAIAAIDVPPSAEPISRWGIGWLTARALGTGAGGRDAQSLEAELELLGASLRTAANRAGILLRLTVPARRLVPALDLLADTLLRPELTDDEVDQLVRLRLDEIAQQRANPRTRAQLEFSRACFTAESRQSCPVGGSADTVRTVDGAAIREFYLERVSQARATLVLAGRLGGVQLAELAQAFWQDRPVPGELPVSELDRPVLRATPRVVLVDFPGAAQTQFMLGTAGTDRLDPDWPALTVAAHALGGTVDSRLNRVLREQRGYTYGVRAAFDACRRGGTFTISGAFHTDVTAPALIETMELLTSFLDQGLRASERDASVDFFSRTAPLAYQTAHSVASRAADLLAHDLPLDFVDRNRDRLAALTAVGVSEAFARLIRPAALAIAVVGDADRITDSLHEAGFADLECLPR